MRLTLSAIGILGSPILQLYVAPLCQVKKPGYSELCYDGFLKEYKQMFLVFQCLPPGQ